MSIAAIITWGLPSFPELGRDPIATRGGPLHDIRRNPIEEAETLVEGVVAFTLGYAFDYFPILGKCRHFPRIGAEPQGEA